MKYRLLAIGLMASFSFFAMEAEADRPCKVIVEACKSAGIIQSGASRQVMLDNCVKPVVAGRVASVTVDPSVIKACKAKMAAQG